ncbi:hypothetical protein Clacol_000797 [Clathrus columnatus]|uniref:N-acetyltransferase domain-containing protein n=1 Tax=Clathrus columnatus TaxID=1419009 RepID=A0AAV5A000_9AGAM|nr:hypothetical protein Clacol_000797 [Clathrus columnatus]
MDRSTSATKRPIVVRVSPATRHDVPALARANIRAFENTPHLPIFSPQYVNVFGEELLRIGLPLEMNKLRQTLVGTDIHMKASVSTMNEQGETVDTIVGYASWTHPDGPRKRTIWEWFLSTIFYPIRNLFKPSPIPEGLPQVLEMVTIQKEQIFGKGGKWEGRKHWHSRLLYVDPDWRGLGVASALLQWGFEKARETNSVIYLESRYAVSKLDEFPPLFEYISRDSKGKVDHSSKRGVDGQKPVSDICVNTEFKLLPPAQRASDSAGGMAAR